MITTSGKCDTRSPETIEGPERPLTQCRASSDSSEQESPVTVYGGQGSLGAETADDLQMTTSGIFRYLT